MRCNGSNWAVYSPGSWDGFRNDVWALWAGVICALNRVKHEMFCRISKQNQWYMNTFKTCTNKLLSFSRSCAPIVTRAKDWGHHCARITVMEELVHVQFYGSTRMFASKLQCRPFPLNLYYELEHLKHPAGWICAHYKSLLLLLLIIITYQHGMASIDQSKPLYY